MASIPQTLEDRFVAADRRPAGFDYLRLILSVTVVLSHTINVTDGYLATLDFWNGWRRPGVAVILPLFFALSGFLVAGSLQRCRTLVSFVGLRMMRLVPALAMETVISGLLIGTIFTSLPLRDYVADPMFHRYFLNVVGDIQYVLPGVFHGNPVETINGQLWTLPYELACYTVICALAFLRAARRPRLFLAIVLLINAALIARVFRHAPPAPFPLVPGPALVLCFLWGLTFHFFRASIPWSGRLGLLCAAALGVLLLPAFSRWGDFVAPVFATYLTVYLGFTQPRRWKPLLGGDYSYGIFLYGFPVQQAVVAATGASLHRWYLNFLISMPLVIAAAVFSWWCIEKPAMKLRPSLIRFEEFLLRLAARIPGGLHLLPAPIRQS